MKRIAAGWLVVILCALAGAGLAVLSGPDHLAALAQPWIGR